MFFTSVKHPINFFSRTVHAANVWSVRIEGPVSNWKSDHLDASIRQVLNVFLSVPGIPVISHDLVAFLWTKGLAESVGVHAYAL